MARPFIVTAAMANKYARLHLFTEEYDKKSADAWCILLHLNGEVMGHFFVQGGVWDNIGITRAALALEAKGVIIVSNHPCDDPNPTESELYGTGALKKALSTFDIQLIDHIILAESSFYSFAEEEVKEL